MQALKHATQAECKKFPDNLPIGWKEKLSSEANEDYFKNLCLFLKIEKSQKKKIFPQSDKILRALQLVDYNNVKVVILGQDPYHGPDQAVGLSFAVPNELTPKPPSLLNIFKEIESDIGTSWNRKDSELTGWADQGVLLLNTVLTVVSGQPLSHRNKGWEVFTDKIINILNEREKPMVFILWGSSAQAKQSLIDTKKHFVLKSAHPSPLSAHRGFFGSKPFSKANKVLADSLHETPIDWAKIN